MQKPGITQEQVNGAIKALDKLREELETNVVRSAHEFLRRHADQLVVLRDSGATSEQIAECLNAAGIKISAGSVRVFISRYSRGKLPLPKRFQKTQETAAKSGRAIGQVDLASVMQTIHPEQSGGQALKSHKPEAFFSKGISETQNGGRSTFTPRSRTDHFVDDDLTDL